MIEHYVYNTFSQKRSIILYHLHGIYTPCDYRLSVITSENKENRVDISLEAEALIFQAKKCFLGCQMLEREHQQVLLDVQELSKMCFFVVTCKKISSKDSCLSKRNI